GAEAVALPGPHGAPERGARGRGAGPGRPRPQPPEPRRLAPPETPQARPHRQERAQGAPPPPAAPPVSIRPPPPPRSRAALLAAAVALSPSTTWARDTAGPDPRPRPAPRAQRAATPSAAPAPPPSVAPAPSAAPAPSDSAPPTEATPTADTPPSPDDAERAKRLYASGAEAFAAQRNADAIGYFRRAAQLVPSPKLTYNIGLAYEEMGDAARALAEYRTYLEQEEEHDPARRDEVKARIAHLEQRLAETGVQQLRVKSAPDGA